MDKNMKIDEELLRENGRIRFNETELLNINGEIIERTIVAGIMSLIVVFDVGVCNLNSNEALNHAVTICGATVATSQIPNALHIADLILRKHELKKENKIAKEKMLDICCSLDFENNFLGKYSNNENLQEKGKTK